MFPEIVQKFVFQGASKTTGSARNAQLRPTQVTRYLADHSPVRARSLDRLPTPALARSLAPCSVVRSLVRSPKPNACLVLPHTCLVLPTLARSLPRPSLVPRSLTRLLPITVHTAIFPATTTRGDSSIRRRGGFPSTGRRRGTLNGVSRSF